MAIVSCDVCGRTLLRGENADVFLHGGTRRTVCELCTSRAVHEGWMREGADDALGAHMAERGGARGILSRLRGRRDHVRRPEPEPAPESPTYAPAPPTVERIVEHH